MNLTGTSIAGVFEWMEALFAPFKIETFKEILTPTVDFFAQIVLANDRHVSRKRLPWKYTIRNGRSN